MKCIVLAAIIVVSLIMLSASFVQEHDPPKESLGHLMQGYLSKPPLPLAGMGKITFYGTYGTFTPVDHSQAVPEAGHRNLMQEKASDLSKDSTSVQEMVNSLRDRIQGMINMVRTEVVPAVNSKIVAPLRDYMQSIINMVRTEVVPAVNSKIVAPLRDLMESMINMVRTEVVPAVKSKIVAPLRDYTQNIINKVRTDRPSKAGYEQLFPNNM